VMCDLQPNRIGCKIDRFRRSGYFCEADVPSSLADLPRESVLCFVGAFNTILDSCYLHQMFKPNLVSGKEPSGYAEALYQQFQNSLTRYASYHRKQPCLTSWIKFLKYKLCAYFSACENDILPPKPAGLEDDRPDYLFGGVIGQFLRQHNRRQRGILAYQLMMSKKGMPRAGEESIREAEEKMINALTQERITGEVTLPLTYFSARTTQHDPRQYKTTTGSFENHKWECNVVLGRREMEHQLRRTIREIFVGSKFGPREMAKPCFPSPNSNYNRSRSGLGGVGSVKEECGDLDFVMESSLHEATFYEPINLEYGEKGRKWEDLNFPHDSRQLPVGVIDPTSFDLTYRRLYWRLFKKAMTEEPLVEAVGLPEALKIRVISKGPPLTYFVLKSFQRFMWQRLRKFRIFRLIGQPVVDLDIESVCKHDGAWLLSGDYVSSTDNIHTWATETCVDEMRRVLDLPVQMVELLLRALTRHIFVDSTLCAVPPVWSEDLWEFVYEEKPPKETFRRRNQKTGQLMGSIVSFPILCIINATGCRMALECADGREYEISDPCLRLVVNGDDCLLASPNKELYEWWRRILSVVGLEESVGKTYFNQRFAVINSALYDYCSGSRNWVERRYVNMGLVKGLKRAGGEDDRTPWDVALCFNDLVRTCPSWLTEEATALFIKYNRKVLQEYEGPWYFPRYAGGLGMVKELSVLDRMVLRCIQSTGAVDRVLAWPAAKPWQTWDLAHDELKKVHPLLCEVPFSKVLCTHEVELEDEQERATSIACWKALLTRTVTDLYQSLNEEARGRAAKVRNAIVYARCLELVKKGSSYYKPVEEDYIWEERKKGLLNLLVSRW